MAESYQFARGARLSREFAANQARNVARSRTQRRRHAESGPARLQDFTKAFSANALLAVAELLRADGPDKSPGIDSVRFGDLCKPELAAICRELSQVVLNGTFTPSWPRVVQQPKAKGGYRPITIRSVAFRIVARRLHEVVSQYVDPQLSPACVGGRPGRSVWGILASLAQCVASGNGILAVDDINRAFDNIRHSDALEEIRTFIGDVRYMALIEALLRGHPNELRVVGIDQGCAFSTDVLNILLHRRLDVHLLDRFPNLFLRRYIDDLVYAVQTPELAREVRGVMEDALGRVGLQLKPAPPPPALFDGGEAVVLGFIVKLCEGNVRFEIPAKAWVQLVGRFEAAYSHVNPAMTAQSIACGWIACVGPALPGTDWNELAARVCRVAADCGFHEIWEPDIRRAAQAASDRWTAFKAANMSSTV